MAAPAFLMPREYVASPEAMAARPALPAAQAYTRWLATGHYENFHVVSVLLPRHLHQDFYNVYAFCRWADDLGDEIGDAAESLRLLGWWRRELAAMAGGEVRHPVFVALRETIRERGLDLACFHDLITAFEQDQRVTRYESLAQLYRYCQYSANPVGRLVLQLCGYRDERRFAWSDQTCTALQLANFWQDVSVDLQKGRVYIPRDCMARHGYREEQLFAGEETDAFRAVLRDLVIETRRLFHAGLPLVRTVDRRLAFDLELFSRGGLCVLDKIEAQDYRVLLHRPKISKMERVALLLSALVRVPFQRKVAA